MTKTIAEFQEKVSEFGKNEYVLNIRKTVQILWSLELQSYYHKLVEVLFYIDRQPFLMLLV